MKWLAVALAALALGGCAKNIDNQEAVQKAIDQYFSDAKRSNMVARVQSVIFKGSEADATVMVNGKGSDPATGIPMPYVLEKQSSGWVVKGPAKNAMAGHAQQNGGQMPPGHPPAGNAPGAEKDGSQKLSLPPDHPPVGGASK